MADSNATSNRPLMLDKSGVLIEVVQTTALPGGREKMVRHAGIYVPTHRWHEDRNPNCSQGHRIGRALQIVDLAFRLGLNLAENECLQHLDLFAPGVVEGLIIEAVNGTTAAEETPSLVRFLNATDLESMAMAPDGIRLRVLMPDYTTPIARSSRPPVWLVYLCDSLVGTDTRFMGTIAESGFVPNPDLDDEDEGDSDAVGQSAPVRRVPVLGQQQAAEQQQSAPAAASAAVDTAFSAMRDLNPDFWSAIGGVIDTL